MNCEEEKDYYKKLGKSLASMRGKHLVKQRDLADHLNLSPSMLSEVEKGSKKLSHFNIQRYKEGVRELSQIDDLKEFQG